ncbi:MAG: NAD(+) diphosphatase, partial [Dechloromonas sp.]|nr:NAD(+) diphosphatase [Dechloromonas sp.]
MTTDAYWILRYEHRLLVCSAHAGEAIFPCAPASAFGSPESSIYVGEYLGLPCRAVDVAEFPQVAGAEPAPLRAIFTLAGPEVFALAGRATQLLDWQANHRYCGRCGTPTEIMAGEPAMRCPACGLLAYPRLSPAVMVLVRDGEKLLLARSPHFKPGVYSALAGFVEPGETLEQCAAREVLEEVGIEIANLRYFAS